MKKLPARILGYGISPMLKFIYSEKATKFCKISTSLLSYVVPVKSKVEISQNVVAFSECMNFTVFHFLRTTSVQKKTAMVNSTEVETVI